MRIGCINISEFSPPEIAEEEIFRLLQTDDAGAAAS